MLLKLIRLLIAFALTLTVPLQGLASVTAGLCTAMGHHEAAMSVGHDQGTDHHAHDMDASAAHCPPCVACCAAAAISPFTQVLIPEASVASAITALPLSFSGIQPETLDRPPLAL